MPLVGRVSVLGVRRVVVLAYVLQLLVTHFRRLVCVAPQFLAVERLGRVWKPQKYRLACQRRLGARLGGLILVALYVLVPTALPVVDVAVKK